MRQISTLVLALMLASLITASTSQAVTRIPNRCTDRIAPTLCAIHFHRDRADQYRARLGLHRLRYRWMAEKSRPAQRAYYLHRWMRLHSHWRSVWRHRTRNPWSHSWYSAALCVHHYEGAWNDNTGNGYYGGMQFDASSWLSNGGGKYASRADLASPHDQLLVAYHYYRAEVANHVPGWSPWPTTARMCGLL